MVRGVLLTSYQADLAPRFLEAESKPEVIPKPTGRPTREERRKHVVSGTSPDHSSFVTLAGLPAKMGC